MSFAAFTLVASAVSAGVGFIGSMQQAKAASAIADQNAAIQMANARAESQAQQTQAAILRTQTQANFRGQAQQAAQAGANADAKSQAARAQESVNARNLRLRREEGGRLMASQQAKFAAAGIVGSTGSPLSLLAETAGIIQRDIGEQQYHNELAVQGLYQDAALERLGGQYALAGATLDKSAGMSEAKLREAGATQTLLSGQRTAQITRMAGASQAQGLRYGAVGNLLGAAGGMGDQYYKFKQYGAFA